MTSITIDEIIYDLDTLSGEAKAKLVRIQFVDQELERLQAQTAALQKARIAYTKDLWELWDRGALGHQQSLPGHKADEVTALPSMEV